MINYTSRLSILLLVFLLLSVSVLVLKAAEMTQTLPAADNNTTASLSAPPPGYKLQKEDVMRISVWGEQGLTTDQVVDPNGYINVPLLGQIFAEGLTVQQLVDTITEGLKGYLVEPKVQISMMVFRKPKVYVLGQVNRPGLHEIKAGDRVMEVIAQAGSFTEIAYLEGATITHKGSDTAIPLNLHKLFYGGDMSQNMLLQDGDTIYIPEDVTNKYYVLGEVVRPGLYRLKEKVNVIEAISNAGGPTQRGNLKAACVIRGEDIAKQATGENGIKPERIKVDVSKLIKNADMSQNIELRPGDVVYVPESSKPDWNKIAAVLSAIVNVSYLSRIWGL